MKHLIILFISTLILMSCETEETIWTKNYGTEYQGVEPSILFLGDSRIDCFDLDVYFDNHMFNYGRGGYRTNEVLDIVVPTVKQKDIVTDKVIISVGINDISSGYPEQYTIDNIELIINSFPESEVYVTNIIPYGWANIDSINIKLKNLCDSMGITYIDCIDMENESGMLRGELTNDGTHYSGQGYQVLSDCLMSYIQGV